MVLSDLKKTLRHDWQAAGWNTALMINNSYSGGYNTFL